MVAARPLCSVDVRHLSFIFRIIKWRKLFRGGGLNDFKLNFSETSFRVRPSEENYSA